MDNRPFGPSPGEPNGTVPTGAQRVYSAYRPSLKTGSLLGLENIVRLEPVVVHTHNVNSLVVWATTRLSFSPNLYSVNCIKYIKIRR